MFHVKLDKQNPFSPLVDGLLKNKIFSVSGLPIQALPSFLDLTQKKTVVLLDSFEIKDVVRAFEKRIGVDVACLSRDRSVSPGNFSEYFGNLFSLSKNFISATPSSVFLCFVDRELCKKNVQSCIRYTCLTYFSSFFFGGFLNLEECLVLATIL